MVLDDFKDCKSLDQFDTSVLTKLESEDCIFKDCL